jgi:hypothetical protein
LSGECAAGSKQRAIDGKSSEAAGGIKIPLPGVLVLYPVREYCIHHGIGFCKPTNAVTFHLPPGLSLQSQGAIAAAGARLKSS